MLDKYKAKRHVAALCKQYGISRKEIGPTDRGGANVPNKSIKVPPITDQTSYFVNLHEIGHIAEGLSDKYRLVREGKATKFAYDKSIWKPELETKQRMAANLLRYWIQAQDGKYTIPPKDAVFWTLLRWWEL